MENNQPMRNPAKAILVSILIPIPARSVLGVLPTTSLAPPRLLAIGEGFDALGSQGGNAAYLMAFVNFGVVGFLAIAIARKQPAPAARTQSRPARVSQP